MSTSYQVFGLWLIIAISSLILFFFVTTRGSLIIWNLFSRTDRKEHIYWLYRNPLLVWLTDRECIVSAVLLFHYHHLVRVLLSHLTQMQYKSQQVVQIAAVSGNLTEKLRCTLPQSVTLSVIDRETSGLQNTRRKLSVAQRYDVSYTIGEATQLPIESETCDCALSFFLFHELPHDMKWSVFEESLRILRPGGTFLYAEFHRPHLFVLRLLGSIVFGLFEPHAKEMWSWDPLETLNKRKFTVSKTEFFHGYFQVVSIQKQ